MIFNIASNYYLILYIIHILYISNITYYIHIYLILHITIYIQYCILEKFSELIYFS